MLPYRLWFKFVLPVIAWSNFTRYGLFPCRPALMIMLSGSAGFPGHCSLRASPGCPIGIPLVLPEEVSHPFCLVGRKHALTRLDTHGRSTLRWIAFSFYHAYSYICLCRTPRRIKNCKPTWFLLLLLELACPKTRRQPLTQWQGRAMIGLWSNKNWTLDDCLLIIIVLILIIYNI